MPEVYIPGSTIPFKPVNPWGRAMPKPTRPDRPPLFQLVVRRDGKETRIGPMAPKDFIQQLYEAVDAAIRVGVEKDFTDPHIVRCV